MIPVSSYTQERVLAGMHRHGLDRLPAFLSFFPTLPARQLGTREVRPGCQGVLGAGKYSKGQYVIEDNCFVKGRAGC